jgi:hypothetical protein
VRVKSGWLQATRPVANSTHRSSAFSVCRPLDAYK